MRYRLLTVLCLAAMPSAAWAGERDYCPDRPGISTPACTMAPGEWSVEVGLGDWTLDRSAGQREDVTLLGDTLLRRGIAEHAELQVEWAALGLARTRDEAVISHATSVGDFTLAVRRNLANPDGSGLSVALMPFVSLPLGHEPVGAGDWAAGLQVPLSYEVSDKVSLVTTTAFEAAVDEDGHGRHFAFDETVGTSLKLDADLTATAEYQFTADRDPQQHHDEHLAGLSLGWQPSDDLQLDLGANAGLDHDAPDMEVYVGVSRRF
ncbi:MAG: transporter [Novosphingobium sp.]